MTKERILRGIRKCAQKLGRAPSFSELQRAIKVKRSALRKHFMTYTAAVRACGLERQGGGCPASLDALFRDWAGVARKLRKLPSVAEYEMHGSYSLQPLVKRFKSWRNTPLGLMLYAQENGLEEEWKDVLAMVKGGPVRGPGGTSMTGKRAAAPSKKMKDRPTYGPPITRGPLAHGPENEQGVLFLFGALAEGMGFQVQKLQMAFPDCEALREVEPGVWQRVRIEFEYESRNFLLHMHDRNGCDILVCWKHNWPDCPLEVVELKAEITKALTTMDTKVNQSLT